MTVWSWLKLTACLWLIRKAFRLAWWLLLAVAAIAAWPVTVVTATGYVAAWLRGWPPVRLYRAAAWSLPVTAAWLITLEIQVPGFLAAQIAGGLVGLGLLVALYPDPGRTAADAVIPHTFRDTESPPTKIGSV